VALMPIDAPATIAGSIKAARAMYQQELQGR
jgi:hypothetical protein